MILSMVLPITGSHSTGWAALGLPVPGLAYPAVIPGARLSSHLLPSAHGEVWARLWSPGAFGFQTWKF